MSRGRQTVWFLLVAISLHPGCGFVPERVSRDDPRLKPMFEAMARVDRRAMGFTPVERTADIRVEWGPRQNYDAMLHVYGKTSRTVAFRRIDNGYEWIGEQESFDGPHEYHDVDGTFQEHITITYDRVPISGTPLNTVSVDYRGEEPDLVAPRHLSLDTVRPWLRKWGYE